MTTYKNPWQKNNRFMEPEYTTDATPTDYKGYLIYHRIKSGQPTSLGKDCFDIVQDDVCIGQCAGLSGAHRFIDSLK